MCLPETGYLPPRSLFVYVENTHTHLPKVVRDTGRTGCEMNSDASALSPPPPYICTTILSTNPPFCVTHSVEILIISG